MKKHLLLNQLFGTVGSPNQTDETLTRENRVGRMSYLRRTLMLLFAVLVMSIANIGMAWAESVSLSADEMVAGSKKSHITPAAGAEAAVSEQQVWLDGTTKKKYNTLQLSSASSAGEALSALKTKSVFFTIDDGYKISGLTINGASNKDSDKTPCEAPIVLVCWTGAVNSTPALITQITLPHRQTASLPSIVASSIPNGTKTIALYRQVKVNNTTTPTELVSSGGSSYGSSITGNLVSVTITYETSAAASWKLRGSWNSWEGEGATMTESAGVASISMELSANSRYEFKFKDPSGNQYGNTGAIINNMSGWEYRTDRDNGILYTGPAGNYTFTINTTTHIATVTYPTVDHPCSNYVYFIKDDSWNAVRLYNWQDGSSDCVSNWDGSPTVGTTTTICGTTYYYCAAYYNRLIFRDNGTNQTMTFVKTNGQYLDQTETGGAQAWRTFTTYTISFAGNGNTGGSMSAIAGICPNGSQTLPANTFEKTGYTFAGWKDASSNDYADEATISSITSNITLTAQWTPIPVSTITVSPASKTLDVAGTQQLSTEVLPATALDKTVTWTTSNGSIATVSSTGLVTAVAPGSCTITATAHDGSLVTGTCSITVNKIQPTKYSFSVDKTTLCGGETATLTLAGSQSGVTYELREDSSTPIAETQKTGTGSALTWTGLGAGNYVVYAVADATYTERQMDGSKITVSNGTATSITTQPTNQEVTVGEEATLTVEAAGTSLSYQWKESATEDGTYSNVASGGTSASYSVTPAAAGTKWYKCEVTGTCGEVTTEARKIVANAAKITPTVTWTTVPSTVYKGGKYAIEVSTNTDASLVAGNLTCTNGTLSGVAVSDGVFTGYLEIATNASSAPTLTLTTSAGSTYAAKTETNDDIELGNCEGGGGSTIYSYTITSTSDVTGGSATGGSVDIKGLASDGTSTYGGVNYYKIGGNFSTSNRYIKITLSGTTLAAGDVITLLDAVTSNSSGTFILYDSEGTARYTYGNISTKDVVTEQEYTITVGDGLVGSSVFYIGRNGSNGRIRTITITRSGGGSSQTTNLTWSGGLVDEGSVDKTVGDADFTYTASSNNSNGAISYSSGTTSVATINSSTGEVTIESAGSTTITATIAESGCYPTKSITYTLTVTADVSTYTLTASATVSNPMTEDSKTGAITGNFTNNPVTDITSGTTTSTSSNTFTVNKGTPVTVTAAATIAGTAAQCDECTYVFNSWENIPASVTADVSTIHAIYKTTYGISFKETDETDVAGISASSYDYGVGKAASTLPTPTKSGYTFGGWYNENTLTTPAADIDDDAWGNITYYAKWTAAASLTALVANTLYEVPDMIPDGASLTDADQFFDGLSANTKFELIGSGSSSTTPKVNNNSSNDKTIDGITFDDGSMWFKGTASVTDNIPTTFGLSFIVPEGGGKLYLYFSGTSTNIKLAKSGSSGSNPSCPNGYGEVDVTAGTYYLYGTGTTAPYCFYGLKLCSKYSVSITTTNVTKATGDATAVHGKAYTATFTANTGYTLPSDATVSIGGTPQTKGTGYTWTISDGTATLTIPAANVTDDIAVSVAGVAATTYDVDFSLTNVAYSSGDNEGTDAATEGVEFSTIFAASSGYSLPGTITVTIGGVEQTAGTGYTWAQGSGTLTIPAAYVTGDIVVTIVGEEMEGDGCDELVHTEAATATTLTTTVGSATLTSPSGQTANDKAIKLNSSGYIELSPKAGKSFAAGDSLIIVMWNQASSAKTTGYRIAGTDYTASMPSKVNTTFRRKLIAADIVSSKVKIERESANGSNAYFVSAIIKHCEDLPSCTTPTLPTLSNQTVCPGSDIAAWNAEPTNIATITGASEDVAYSWKKKGSDTELAATASFDLGSSATEGMAGTYVVTVTVSKTGYISKSASAEVDLTVTPATETPSITASKAKVYATDEVTLTATCGSTGVTWNWYLCANADGTGAGSSLGTSETYTIASAPAAGTYYYKAVATGDGTNSCGAAEYVYTLVVSTADACDKEFWFAKEGDRPTGAAAATHITGCPSGSSSASYTASVDGTNYTLTGSTGQKTGDVTIVVPADNTGTLYVVVQGSSSRTITLSKGGTQIGQETPENSTWGVFTFDDLDAGTYNLVSSGNISWAMMALKLCPTVACTDDTPTAAATNATVCAGGSITITATGYEAGATFQWQKQNASTSVWENIDGATSDTYTVTTAAAEHAGNYHIVATKGCARTSNTVTIAVPSAPVFNSFTTTRRIMETQALAISDVSATDAVSYTWYKSADATWDAGDEEIGDTRSLLKPYDGEAAGSTYYVICRAANSCGTTTSSAITVTVQTLIEEDCAIAGNSGEHNTYAQTGNVSSGTYGSITERHTNSNNKYIYYTAESGYYFATATVNACVGNASDLPTAAYSYSTDGGANWTDQNLTGMTAAYADHVINLPANVNAFRVGRRLGDCGTSSNTIYIHQVCFTYNENCMKTTVEASSASVTHEIGDSFTEPTFTVKSNSVALSPQPTITYTSSDETVATVDDDGTVNFQDKAGTVVITAAYAGDATYCESEGSYTITVSCSDEAPKVIAADGTNIGGCNDNITLEAKKQDGTTNFSDGTYQWYRDGEAISDATGRTYTVSLTGVYSVERTSVGGCVSPSSNKATVTSESAEPEVERLTPFQYYHVDKVYAETSIMRFRHLFAVKNAGTTLEGKHFKMELSRNGGAASDVTNSNAFVMSADTVLLDLNKLYGKYEEDDELELTCSAVDCEGNVSSIYKNTITIYVIDETPTLALICSGASGDGTRKTSNLVVGGDFLTGYNKADLCVQTGNTSFDKTQEWVLYTRLKENYIVTPVNGYAPFYKLNYEPFDILFLTDYPKASKSDAAATILDDMADLCDYRPLFTFKTHMVHKSPSKWAAKGFMAQPEVPKQSRLRLNIVCYAHPMFDEMKEVSDHIQKDASDHSQIVYTMLAGAGHEGGKGIQGFPIDAAEGFVTIGLVHYDATAADDTPSDGYVTWTLGTDDVMLVAAAERQVNLEARMILFSVNCGAQSMLTETGRQVVLKSLEYLLSDATITPVADCSFTFTNGAGNDWTYEQYKAKCPACTGTIGDGKWSTAGNWGPDWILQPGKDTEVKIAAPVTVDMPHAKVRTVRILEGGSIDIPAGSGLEVGSTIRRLDGTEISPTEVVDLSIGSTSSGNGTLIFNNNAGDTKAGVAMYSKGFIDYTDPSKPKGIKNYQYIGVPFTAVNALYNYYGSWLYSWSDKGSGYGWQKVPNGGTVTAWTGYCITQETATTHWSTGTLAATNTVDIEVPAGENMVVGNSWTAPIYIKELTNDDFENLDGNVYFFNTGVDKSGDAGTAETRYQNSTYVTVPIHSSPYTGDSLISSMQGFFVKNTSGSDGVLHLDYDRHVRPSTNRNILSGEMHAPVRRANAQSDEPTVLKIKVSGENYDDKLLLLEREDFTTGLDNGWDGDKWDGNESALYIYTKDSEGTENSVSAIPQLEGTVIGFRAGEDEAYTLHFEYLNSDETLYLYDVENNTYTQIMTGMTYRFFTTDNEKHDRFILTRKNPQVATGVEEPTSGSVDRSKAKKLLIEEKMFIIVNGMLYDATGKVVK